MMQLDSDLSSAWLLDGRKERLVEIRLREITNERYLGTLSFDELPESMRKVFREFDEIVNGQIFSLLDEIETRIEGLNLGVELDGQPQMEIGDLQIFPDGNVSFRICGS